MKIKQAMRYQLYAFARPTAIYYAVMISVHIITFIITKIVFAGTGEVDSNGADLSTAVFLFIMGLNAFKSPFQLLMQNGISRRTMFVSFLGSALLLSIGTAIIDSIYPRLFSTHTVTSFFQSLYNPAKGFGSTVTGFFWTVLFFFDVLCAGFLITNLYYRMHKVLKVIVSAGVPVLLFVVFPFVEVLVPTFHFYSFLFKLVIWCLGGDWNNVLGGLHAIGRSMLMFGAFSSVMAALSFLLMRRATLKASA